MGIDDLRKRAELYAAKTKLILQALPMGYGQDGYLWATEQTTAVKVFYRQMNYDRELACYPRLSAKQIQMLAGFRVPCLVDFDDDLLVIEMSIVRPPFLLDFGKAYLDTPPEFDEETMADWSEQLVDLFADRLPEVMAALRALETQGIYYLDAKPGNIMF